MKPPSAVPLFTRRLDPAHIDLSDSRYRLRPVSDDRPDRMLEASMARSGLLVPPLLEEKDDTFIVVSGRRRVQAAQRLGFDAIDCHVLRTGLPPVTFCETFLVHAMQGATLSVVEQARFFTIVAAAMLQEKELLSLLKEAGLKPQPWMLTQLKTCLDLDPEAVLALHSGQLSMKNGVRMSRLDPEDQRCVTGLIIRLRLGGSKQQKLIDYALELVLRDQHPFAGRVQEILPPQKGDNNRPQLTRHLFAELEKMMFPRRSRAEERFRKTVTSLDLPAGARLSHTQDFEDERVELTIGFDSMNHFQRLWPRLMDALNDHNEEGS